jgi:hypothetical protein
MHRKSALFAAACTAFVALVTPLASQAQSTYDDNQQLLAQIQSDKRAIVLKTMGLDDAQVTAFTPVYDAYQAERKKLAERTVDLLNSYASNYESMTDDAAKGLLKDWLKLQDDQIGLTRTYAKKMAKVLPQTKVLRFVQIENKLNTVLALPGVRAVPLVQ